MGLEVCSTTEYPWIRPLPTLCPRLGYYGRFRSIARQADFDDGKRPAPMSPPHSNGECKGPRNRKLEHVRQLRERWKLCQSVNERKNVLDKEVDINNCVDFQSSAETYQSIILVHRVRVSHLNLGRVPLSILSVFRWDLNVRKDKVPRLWKSHAKVNTRGMGTINGSILVHRLEGAKGMSFNNKRHLAKCTRSSVMFHSMSVMAFTTTRHITKEMNRWLLVHLALLRIWFGAIFAFVLWTLIWNKWVELFPIIRPARLDLSE